MYVLIYSEFSEEVARVDLLENPYDDYTYDVVRITHDYGADHAIANCDVSWDVDDFYYNIEVPYRINLPGTAVLHESEVTTEDMKGIIRRLQRDLTQAKSTIDSLDEHIEEMGRER